MTQENPADDNVTIDSENIFDEFTNSDDIKAEINRTEILQQKDMYYYFKKGNTFLLTINIIIFIVLIIGSLYIYIQEQESKKEYSFLSPICNIFLGNDNITPGTCYGVNPILNEYNTLLSESISQQATKIFPILGDIYSIENFNLSKKVSFLLEKNETRLKPLEILSAFDELKNTFSPTDKGEITCYGITVSDNILDITCDAFSSDWNTDILTLNDGVIETIPGGGTSISRASSFIYIIENYRDSSFVVIEKPESLTSTSVQSGPYTQMTTFALKLQYIPQENLTY